MMRRLLAAAAGLVLLQTPALADSQYIGAVSMYLCDGGLDLCSNTLNSVSINLPPGSFTEDFVFDLVNDLPDVPDNVPLLKATAFLGASSQAEFSSASVQLYNSSGVPIGINGPGLGSFAGPFAGTPYTSYFKAQSDSLIHPGTGYFFEVSGVSNGGALPLTVSINAFDLGPVVLPEPTTWAMMLLGVGGLGLAAWRRTSRPLAIG